MKGERAKDAPTEGDVDAHDESTMETEAAPGEIFPQVPAPSPDRKQRVVDAIARFNSKPPRPKRRYR